MYTETSAQELRVRTLSCIAGGREEADSDNAAPASGVDWPATWRCDGEEEEEDSLREAVAEEWSVLPPGESIFSSA